MFSVLSSPLPRACAAAVVASACCAADQLLVLGYNSNNVVAYDAQSGASLGELVGSSKAGLSLPYAMLAHDGELLLAVWGANAVWKFDGTTGNFLRILVPPQTGGMNLPAGLAMGPEGALYVSSANSDAILRFDRMTGTPLGVFADSADGLDEPDAMLWHGGRLLVCSRANHRVYSFDATGGSSGPLVWNDPGTPQDESGGLQAPRGLAIASDGRLLVSSSGNNRVLAYNVANGAIVTTAVASGAGGLSDPRGIAVDDDGRLYIASFATHSIKRFSALGAPLGDFVPPFSGGLASPTQLFFAQGESNNSPGDMNCDGVLSVGDISGFVLALTNPDGYAAAFPNCDRNLADVNGDSAVSVGDIGPFVLALTSG